MYFGDHNHFYQLLKKSTKKTRPQFFPNKKCNLDNRKISSHKKGAIKKTVLLTAVHSHVVVWRELCDV